MEPSSYREYEYRIKLSTVLPLGVFLAIAAVAFAIVAYRNDRALVLNGICIPAGAATVFYWIASGGFALAVAGMAFRASLIQRVALTPTTIVVPKAGWSSAHVEIPYAAIKGIKEVPGVSPPQLSIAYRDGARGRGFARILASRLPSALAYDTIRQTVAEQVAAAQAADLGY